MESKRGIAESQNIKKITELSFLFIPLTFSASVFSMQVRELKDSPVSIVTFFLVAFVLIVALYGLRLVIRSSSLTMLKKKCVSQVRANARLRPGAFIPTRSYLAWACRNTGLSLGFIMLISSPVIPGIVFLWKKVPNVHLNAFITLFVLFDTLFAACSLGRVLFYSDSRGLQLRYSIFPLKKIERHPEADPPLSLIRSWRKAETRRARKGVFFVVITNLVCLPLAFLWAQPISIVPKIGVTITMVILVYIPIYVFPSCSARPSSEDCEAIRETLSEKSLKTRHLKASFPAVTSGYIG